MYDHGWNSNVRWDNTTGNNFYGTDNSGAIEAFVKDGYLYIFLNGKQEFCFNMVSLFEDYTAESMVTFGLYSWCTQYGTVKFSDLSFLTADEVENETVTEWSYYGFPSNAVSLDNQNGTAPSPAMQNVASYNYETGLVSNTAAKYTTLQFLGKSTAWQIEGTLKREALEGTTAYDFLAGFEIYTGTNAKKELRIIGRETGFAKFTYQQWDNNRNTYNNTKNSYVLADGSVDGWGVVCKSQITGASIDFKAVIYQDKLYVWEKESGTAEENYKLYWRIPLTEDIFDTTMSLKFNGFLSGTSYGIGMVIMDTRCNGSWENLNVKMGYQVTSQEGFAAMIAEAENATKN